MSSSQNPGDPAYRREIGDGGLVLRWSTAADKAGCILVSCLALGLKEGKEAEFALRYSEPYTDDAFFSGSSTNWAVCVDTTPIDKSAPTGSTDSPSYVDDMRAEADSAQERVVALLYFLPAEFSFDGDAARVPVGRVHIVACKPAYRKSQRGGLDIVKSLFEMVHARALSTGCAFMTISGIPSYYRTHGYEFALNFGRGLVTHLSAVRPLPPAAATALEPFTLRPATLDDLPALERLVEAPRATADISLGFAAPVLHAQLRWLLGERPAHYAFPTHPFFVLEKRDAPDASPRIVAAAGLMNTAAPKAGVHPLLWDGAEDASAVALAVVRRLIPALEAALPAETPLTSIRWLLADAHPLRRWLIAHELAAPAPVAAQYSPAPIWWAAIPSLPAFLRALAPALTARLARAAPILGANYKGTLRFAGGVLLHAAAGTITVAEDGDRAAKPAPSLTRGALVQLLLGYASFAALQALQPDVAVEPALLPLVEVLFPPRQGDGATFVGAHYVIKEGMVFK
ncbi:hypothetical protein DFH09DRAFT_1368655 [Mycena vulgaris]|nr:hypothetical protein DFH09DRAFT_1368655 [Mycena vulgaris]